MRAEKQNSEVRQDQIITAAMALIAEQGLKALSVAALAQKVGIVPSALYRHFQGKEEIIKGALKKIKDLLMTNVQSVRQASPNALERLRLLTNRHIAMIKEFQAIPRIVFSDEINASYPLGRSTVYAILRAYLAEVASIVRQGEREGQIKPELDPETVAVFYLGLVQPPIILWYLSDGSFDAVRHTEKAWAIFKKAIGAQPNRSLEDAACRRKAVKGALEVNTRKEKNHESHHR
ncbi:MAG TPA: TetR/AcrR family transcriptional regulator [Thermodesulfobacteriota bacterium]|nr:TetR/AcrR family transcriptional regulator [Thermodesulfobacteriota bacterium]